jgi:tetratricopeptide (TPR) repeat protein
MKEKIVSVITAVIISLSCTDVTVAQTQTKPQPKITNTPQPTNVNRDNIQPSGNSRLEDIEKRLTKVEAKEEAILGWIGPLIGGLGVALGFITFSPVLGGVILWFLKKAILKQISERVEEIDRDIKNTKDSLKKIKREQILIEDKIKELVETVDDFKSEFKSAREITGSVRRYLGGFIDREINELEETLRKTTGFIQVLVFYEARDFLLENFRKGNYQELERTIPIFQAIIDSDTRKEYFRSRANLAYVLSFKDEPEIIDKAIDLLDEAIEIREKEKEDKAKFYFYEFKRAIYKLQKHGCIINDLKLHSQIEEDFKIAIERNPNIKKITEELQSSGHFTEFQAQFITQRESDLIKQWLKRNQIPQTTIA